MAHARPRIALVLALFLCSSIASASFIATTGDPVSLASLQGQTLTVGDKVFSDFGLFGFGLGGAFKPSLDGIFVQGGHDSVTGDIGLHFVASWTAGAGQLVNAQLSFDVDAIADEHIDAVTFELADVSTTGGAVLAASENVSESGELLALLSVSKQVGDDNAFLVDRGEFAPTASVIHIRKDFSIIGGSVSGVAHVSGFYQYFSQVPEPASVSLLVIGGRGGLASPQTLDSSVQAD